VFLLVATEAGALQDGIWEPSNVEGWEARHRANVQMSKALIDRVRGSDVATSFTNAVVDGLRTADDAGKAAGKAASGLGPSLHWVGKGAEAVDLLAKAVKVADAYNKGDGRHSRAAIETAAVEGAKWLAGNYAGGAAAAFVASKALAWKAAAAGTTTVGFSVIAPAVVAGFATTLLVETMIDPPDLYAARREEFERLVSSWKSDPTGQTTRDNQGRFAEQLRLPSLPIPHLAPDARTVPPADWARTEGRLPPAPPVPLQTWSGTDTGRNDVAADTAGLAVSPPRDATPDLGADLTEDVPLAPRGRERRRPVNDAAAADLPTREEHTGASAAADLDEESVTASTEPARDEPAPGATGPASPAAVDILKYVKAQTATASARRVENLGAGGIGNSLVTEAVLTFWNVGSLVDGHGRAEMKVRSVMTMTGQGDTHTLRGTFSGGPRGTFVFDGPDGPTRFRLSEGKTAVTEGLTFTLSNPEVFKGWPRELQ
jgi:hypothetical protein